MKPLKILLSLIFINSGISIYGQFTLTECLEKAKANYPMVRQYSLIETSKNYDLSNAVKSNLPQLSLSAKATIQTEVTNVPISVPGINIPSINKDQYQIIAEVTQKIWDGGATKSLKKEIESAGEVEQAQYETDMYALDKRVCDLFFGILIIEEQLKLNDIYIDELNTNNKKISAWIENGIANQTDLDVINVEILSAYQRHTELKSMRQVYSEMLTYFIGESGTDKSRDNNLKLIKPEIPELTINLDNIWDQRPESTLFDASIHNIESKRDKILSRDRPKLNAFVQGGYGNPGLNMLKNEFSPYAIGGLRAVWNFGGLYTRKNDLLKIETAIEGIELQQETFMFNNNMLLSSELSEMEKYKQIIQDDEKIAELRRNIKKASESKVENGTMSVTDLIRDINAEQAALRNKAVHEIEMIKSAYDIKNLLNK